MLILIFWISFALILFVYIGYPAVLTLLVRFKKIDIDTAEVWPKISFIIAAYNEEEVIGQKLENTLLLDYPKDKLEIIVVSDCSTDQTDQIVAGYAGRGVKLYRMPKRSGKVLGHKEVVPQASGDIIVFSDATGMYKTDAIKKLARNFNDKRVGVVGGLLKYVNPQDSMLGSGEGLYWRYEVMLRKKESLLGSLPAVSGSIYAFRRTLYEEFPAKLADDFIVPLTAKKKGYLVVFEPQALCVEEAVRQNKQEFSKRARIANQNIRGLIYMRGMLNPFKRPAAGLILFSHKMLRLIAPFLLIAVFILSLKFSGNSIFFGGFFVLQAVFYLFAGLGYIIERLNKKNKLFYIPFYFCTTNFGILLGFFRFLQRKDEAFWEPAR